MKSVVPFCLRALLLAACLFLFEREVKAQDYRVFTKVLDLTGLAPSEEKNAKPIANSLTLFRAGKVYDYVPTAGEVIIFDPANKRFTILSTNRTLKTTVAFSEVDAVLSKARRRTEAYLKKHSGNSKRIHEMSALTFQLAPKFHQTYRARDAKKSGSLQMFSPGYQYVVEGSTKPTDRQTNLYLAYADGISKLNFVLRSSSSLPGPRLALNNVLRKRKLMPTTVTLTAGVDRPRKLRAEHQIHWELLPGDRARLNQWQKMLRDPRTRAVSFTEYQRALEVTQNSTQK